MAKAKQLSTPSVHADPAPAPVRPFLSDLRIDYGPSQLLGRFFVSAVAHMSEMGIALSFGTFDELVEVNRLNRDSWKPLNPTFNPANGLVTADTACVIFGRHRDGTIVTALAVKVFDWSDTTFKAEAESLRLLYADPAAMAPPDGACEVDLPTAGQLTGRVAYSGAGWWHPSVRGQRIGDIISRTVRLYALTRWNIDVSCALSARGLIAKGYTKQNGFPRAELSVKFTGPDLGPPEAGLAWVMAAEMVDDLSGFMDELAPVGSHDMRHAE